MESEALGGGRHKTSCATLPETSSSDSECSLAGWLLLAGWLMRTLVMGLALAVIFQDQGLNWVESVLGGTLGTVILNLSLAMLAAHISVYLRGGPFRAGDQVVITDGPLRGHIGQVQRLCEGYPAVWVAVAHADEPCELVCLDFWKIRRRKRKKREIQIGECLEDRVTNW